MNRFALMLALCVYAAGAHGNPAGVLYTDEYGGLWLCPRDREGVCTLIRPPAPAIELRGLEQGALSA